MLIAQAIDKTRQGRRHLSCSSFIKNYLIIYGIINFKFKCSRQGNVSLKIKLIYSYFENQIDLLLF